MAQQNGRVVFHEDDDTDEDLFHTVVTESKNGKKKASKPISRTPSQTSSSSTIVAPKVKSSQESKQAYESDDASDDEVVVLKSKAKKPLQEVIELDGDDDDDGDIAKDTSMKKFLEARNRIQNLQRVATEEIVHEDSSEPVSRQGSIVVPRVLSIEERKRAIEQRYEDERQAKKKRQSGTSSLAEEDESGCTMVVKSRVQGKDERKWKLNPEQPFEKLRQKIAIVYGFTLKQFSLHFDGEELPDNQSASDIGLEDDDLIEIHIVSKALLQRTLENIGKS